MLTKLPYQRKKKDSRKRKKVKKDNGLYEIEVKEVNKEKKMVLIHYKGYDSRFDEWRPVWNVIFLCTAHLSPCFQLCTESLTGDSLVHTATLGRLGWGGGNVVLIMLKKLPVIAVNTIQMLDTPFVRSLSFNFVVRRITRAVGSLSTLEGRG